MQARIWRMGRAIRASLKGVRKRRVEIAGQEVDTLLGEDLPNAKEACRRLKGWYKSAVNGAPTEDEIEDAIKNLRRNRLGGGVGDAS